jgi:HJR/Mrr/RecB family endonuclease
MQEDIDNLQQDINSLLSIGDRLPESINAESEVSRDNSDIDKAELRDKLNPDDIDQGDSEEDEEYLPMDQSEEEPDEEAWAVDEHLEEAAQSVFHLVKEIFMGDYSRLQYHLNEIDECLAHEGVGGRLLDFDVDPDSISKSIHSLLDRVDILSPYVSPIISVPEVIRNLSDEFLLLLARRPELLYKVDPRLFEELIAEVFRKFNFEVSLTKQTRDGGIDIVAFDDLKYTKNQYIIECKRYEPEKKVGLGIVQRLYGTKVSVRATKAFLVTSSYFSKDALEFAKQHFWELDLKDFNDVADWL